MATQKKPYGVSSESPLKNKQEVDKSMKQDTNNNPVTILKPEDLKEMQLSPIASFLVTLIPKSNTVINGNSAKQ